MPDHGETGFKRLVSAFGFSCKGFSATWRHEAAFRQELAAAVILIPAGLWLGENGVERALLLMPVLLVLLTELINTAIEATVDRFGGEHHPLSGRAKDIGSAAVLTSLVLCGVVWLCILL